MSRFAEALTIQQALRLLREHGPRGAVTRYGLRSPELDGDNPRAVRFQLSLARPSSIGGLRHVLSEAAELSPVIGIDLTLRCFLWDKPLTQQLLIGQIVGDDIEQK